MARMGSHHHQNGHQLRNMWACDHSNDVDPHPDDALCVAGAVLHAGRRSVQHRMGIYLRASRQSPADAARGRTGQDTLTDQTQMSLECSTERDGLASVLCVYVCMGGSL
mmetsp:Transcript_11455/g.33263  ORF Transcript_11455/g.33263 Transcript_11455/m.33263 type:complete len:109 (+) Transcript_11455:308-634(+)